MQTRATDTQQKRAGKKKALFSIHRLVFMGIMVSLSIVLGKFLAFNIGGVLRFSLENLPIIFTGVALGPISGLVVGLVADLIGCFMVGYEINPFVLVASGLIGLLSGLCYKGMNSKSLLLNLSVPLFVAHFIGSVIVKTYGLAEFYLTSQGMGFFTLMGYRGINYLIVGIVELFVIYMLMRSRGIGKQIAKLKGKEENK
ncbi:MAG: folate family ECF transporter S component [Clostridia bacterium]|nr:folate family ECF transporter S component [Clostridia bacterium]